MSKPFVSAERRQSNTLFVVALLIVLFEVIRLVGLEARFNGFDLLVSIAFGFIISRAFRYKRIADSIEHGSIMRARREAIRNSR